MKHNLNILIVATTFIIIAAITRFYNQKPQKEQFDELTNLKQNPELDYLYKMRQHIPEINKTGCFTTTQSTDILHDVNKLCEKVDGNLYTAQTSHVLPPRWLIKTYYTHKMPSYITDKCQNKYLSCLKNVF